MDMEWEDSRLVQASISALKGGQTKMVYQEQEIDLDLKKGETYYWEIKKS